MRNVVEALALLTPYDIDKPKVRLGPDGDGGYVFVDNLTPDQVIVSYGISIEYGLDVDLALKGHVVYMFDHTIAGIEKSHPNMKFYREGVSGASLPDQRLFSVKDHLDKYNIEGDRLILKMDVEGAEFEAIGMMSDSTLCRFEQIVFEIHGLINLEQVEYRDKFVRMLKRLNSSFTLFHVHANNHDGYGNLPTVGGCPVSNLLELSYVRTSSVRRFPSSALYPTSYDFPNVGKRDKLLWFYPFLPTQLSLESYFSCEDLVESRAMPSSGIIRPPAQNVALHKSATQSSIFRLAAQRGPNGAINGEVTGYFAFHTERELNPWWRVDLGAKFLIDQVMVFNRLDAMSSRAYFFILKAGCDENQLEEVYAQSGKPFGGADGKPERIHLNGIAAQFVQIELLGEEYLHLDQVEVYARN